MTITRSPLKSGSCVESITGNCIRQISLLLLVLCFAAPAFGQYTPPTQDAEFGLIGTSCTNANSTFKIVAFNGGDALCTPDGHLFGGLRGAFGFDYSLESTNDETGCGYTCFITAKYGNTANWVAPETAIFKDAGLNVLPSFHTINAGAFRNPTKVPTILFEIMSSYSLYNQANLWGTGPSHEVFSLLGSAWTGFNPTTSSPGEGESDYRDPNWANLAAGVLVNSTEAVEFSTASAAIKKQIVGFTFDDSDGLHGFGATNAFATQPPGQNDFRIGYLGGYVSPVNFANSTQKVIYPGGKVYLKSRWHDLLMATYTNIAGINAAIGSSYTTDGSSGTCVGIHMPITCATNASAITLGTGNGSQTTFTSSALTGTVSKFSIAVYLNSTLVGGQAASNFNNASGNTTIYGSTCSGSTCNQTLSGSFTAGTNTLSVTFVTPPTVGNLVSAEYIQNGWGVGTGLMDEDCRAAHVSYCGTDSINLTGVNAGYQTAIHAYSRDIASYYSSTINSKIQAWGGAHGFAGHILYFGPTTLGTWSTPPDSDIIAGMCGNVDAWMYGGQGTFTQAELDYVNAACPNQPLIEGEYLSANLDSEFAWINIPCTRAGTTVSCTMTTPNEVAAWLGASTKIMTSCVDTTYNVNQHSINSYAAPTMVYTANSTPTNASTTCTIASDDSGVGGQVNQAAKAALFASKANALLTRTYTSGGFKPYLGYFIWQWFSGQRDRINWGVESTRDNRYNVAEPTNSTHACSAPNATSNCGGELNLHPQPYGSYYSTIQSTNSGFDTYFLGGSSGSVTISPSSENFGNVFIAVTSAGQTATVTNNSGSTITLTGNTLTTGTQFAIVGGSSCSGTLTNGSTCTISTTFKPLSVGSLSDTLNISFTGASGSPVIVSLFGVGIAVPPVPAPCVQCILGQLRASGSLVGSN